MSSDPIVVQLINDLADAKAEIDRLRTLVALNCDPDDATESNARAILECFEWWVAADQSEAKP